MMNYETFMKEKDRIAELPDEEQKRFYEKVLEEEKEDSSVKLLAYFQYAVLFIMKEISEKRGRFWRRLWKSPGLPARSTPMERS